ncbi:MAG: DUF3311 domain-containing protein [Rhizomicrobium sp.]
MDGQHRRGGFRFVHLLLIVPFIGCLWVPFYNRALPELGGVPFFYWDQVLWVVLTAVILWIVYRAEERQ